MTYYVNVDEDLRDYIPTFVNNRIKELQEAKSAMNKNDFDSIRKIGHTFKGCCASYGFSRLGELGKNMEELAIEQNSDELNKTFVQMQEILENYTIV